MSWALQFGYLGHVLLAFLSGFLIGLEREYTGVPAGIRTYINITVGACLFGVISRYALGVIDPTRVAAQVVSGIGFLGAGVIFRNGNYIRGLTSAATMWAAAAIGLSYAFSLDLLGLCTTFLVIFTLTMPRLKLWGRIVGKYTHKHYESNGHDF